MTSTPPGAGAIRKDDDGTFRITFERSLAQPVTAVWTSLTDPEKFGTWMEGCEIEPRVGGRVVYDFGEEGGARGEVTSFRAPSDGDPTAELQHTWTWDGLPESVVTWRLEPVDGGARLQLVHRGLAQDGAADFAVGWHSILDILERYVDGKGWDDISESYEENYGVLAEYYAQF